MTRSEFFREVSLAAALAAALAAVLTASSCASPVNDGSITADPERNHPIAVAPSFTSLKLSFAAPSSSLMPDDEARFAGFVRTYLAYGNGSISISAPKGTESSGAIRYFGERLAAMGVPPARILVGTYDAPEGDGRVELGYITYSAHTDACGDWSKNAGDTASNLPMPNFGCATQHNLAAMVSDPRDLAEPRELGPADAMRRSTVIGNYEKGQTTAAQKTADQSGAVSAMGKQ